MSLSVTPSRWTEVVTPPPPPPSSCRTSADKQGASAASRGGGGSGRPASRPGMLTLVDQLAQRSMYETFSRSRSQSPGSAVSTDEPIELAHYPDAKVRLVDGWECPVILFRHANSSNCDISSTAFTGKKLQAYINSRNISKEPLSLIMCLS